MIKVVIYFTFLWVYGGRIWEQVRDVSEYECIITMRQAEFCQITIYLTNDKGSHLSHFSLSL